MKKIISSIVCAFLIAVMVTGCTTSKSFTYKVDNGDKIKVELDTSKGYDLSSSLPFTISKNGQKLSQGTFIQVSYYDQYVNVAENDINSVVLDKGSNDSIEYVFYSYKNSEYNYVIKVKNSNTGILLGNPNSEEEAKTCFNLLKFSIDK